MDHREPSQPCRGSRRSAPLVLLSCLVLVLLPASGLQDSWQALRRVCVVCDGLVGCSHASAAASLLLMARAQPVDRHRMQRLRPDLFSPTSPVPPSPDVNPSELPSPFAGTAVSSLLVGFDASRVTEYDGFDKDLISVDILGQGPNFFSLPRWNQGDYAPRLEPTHPFAQPNLGVVVGYEGFKAEEPHNLTSQAWRPSLNHGVILGSVANNGREWNDGAGRFYGTVACVYDSHGFGYGMDDGTFGNPNPNIDIAIGKVGIDLEANINAAVAWFPYSQGWLAGYVDAPNLPSDPSSKWVMERSHSPLLPADPSNIVQWDKRGARLRLPHVNPALDGMLFLTSTNPGPHNNDLNVASCFVENGWWRIQLREDDNPDFKTLVEWDQSMFAFVYIPFTTPGLVGGIVDGSTGRTRAGSGLFASERQERGRYRLKLADPPSPISPPLTKTEQDGMLLLQVMGKEPGSSLYSRHAFISYDYHPSGDLLVEVHRLIRLNDSSEQYPLADADFAFAWIDFRNPIALDPEEYTGRLAHMMSENDFWTGYLTGLLLAALVASVAAVTQCYIKRSLRPSIFAFAPIPPERDLERELLVQQEGDKGDGVAGERAGEGERREEDGVVVVDKEKKSQRDDASVLKTAGDQESNGGKPIVRPHKERVIEKEEGKKGDLTNQGFHTLDNDNKGSKGIESPS